MKAMKGLLLGTASGLFAVASAQAADLPVKAKPVEYVKVCSVYGAGFFYVPGTDTCLKIGMYLRSDHGYGAGGPTAPPGYYNSTPNSAFTRDSTNFYSFRARINMSTDWRTQTDYGVLRAYAMTQIQASTGETTTGSAGLTRAFIQFAGFTFGHSVSVFDFFLGANYGYAPSIWGASTGVNGTDLIAYTWQLGGGWSISVNAEDGFGRAKTVVNASNAAAFTRVGPAPALAATGPAINSSNQAAWSPDIAGNIRIDQAWGSAQLSGALHNMNASYYSNAAGVTTSAIGNSTQFGHPGETWGWAVQGGFRLLNVFQPRNTFEISGTYSKGAVGYAVSTRQAAPYGSGNTLSMGYAVDGVYVNGSGIEKTEAWGFQAAYQHYWNAQWRTSVVGGYAETNYSDTAANMLCGRTAGSQNQYQNVTFNGGAAATNCSPNYSHTSVSTRTAWNPHPTLEIGLDLIWWHIDTAHFGSFNQASKVGSRPPGDYTFEDRDGLVAIFRVQKNVLP